MNDHRDILARATDAELEEAWRELEEHRATAPRSPVRELLGRQVTAALAAVAAEMDWRDERAGLPRGSTRWHLELDADGEKRG